MLNWLKKLFSSIIKLIKKILPVILLALALWVAFVAPFTIPLLGVTLTGTAGALFLAGTSFLLLPEESADVVEDAARGLGRAATSVVTAAAGVASAGIGALLTSPAGLALIGFGLWYLLGRDEGATAQTTPRYDPRGNEEGSNYAA